MDITDVATEQIEPPLQRDNYEAYLRRLAIEIVRQLPPDPRDAIRVLELAGDALLWRW